MEKGIITNNERQKLYFGVLSDEMSQTHIGHTIPHTKHVLCLYWMLFLKITNWIVFEDIKSRYEKWPDKIVLSEPIELDLFARENNKWNQTHKLHFVINMSSEIIRYKCLELFRFCKNSKFFNDKIDGPEISTSPCNQSMACVNI